jgi:hypothetical protein
MPVSSARPTSRQILVLGNATTAMHKLEEEAYIPGRKMDWADYGMKKHLVKMNPHARRSKSHEIWLGRSKS